MALDKIIEDTYFDVILEFNKKRKNMTKVVISRRFFTVVCFISMFLLSGCVRMVPLQEGMVLPSNSLKKSNHKILVVMDKTSSEKVIIFKPGPFSDKFSLNGGKSIKSNILIFVSSKFQDVDFVNDFSEKSGTYDYYLKIDWNDFKIDMGKTIFSETRTNIYIDYHFMNSKKEVIFTSITDGNSVKSLSDGAIATAINPFVFIATKKAEKLIANSWNEALANSISKFSVELENHIREK